VRKVRQILRDGKGINVKYKENKTIGVGLEKIQLAFSKVRLALG
jgi:hypothetical protein